MRVLFFKTFLLVSLTLTSSSTHAKEAALVYDNGLPLFEKPNSKSKVVRELKQNEKIEVGDHSYNGFRRARTIDEKEETGFIQGRGVITEQHAKELSIAGIQVTGQETHSANRKKFLFSVSGGMLQLQPTVLQGIAQVSTTSILGQTFGIGVGTFVSRNLLISLTFDQAQASTLDFGFSAFQLGAWIDKQYLQAHSFRFYFGVGLGSLFNLSASLPSVAASLPVLDTPSNLFSVSGRFPVVFSINRTFGAFLEPGYLFALSQSYYQFTGPYAKLGLRMGL